MPSNSRNKNTTTQWPWGIKADAFWGAFKKVQIALWGGVLLIILFFVGIDHGLLGEMPDLDEIQNPHKEVSTTVYSSDFEALGSYYTKNRIEVTYDDLSPYLVKALVATEDRRFYEHSGIDIKSLVRAVVFTGFMGRDEGGGSTITQQLAKNLFHKDFEKVGKIKRTSQKLKEWVLAAKLERTFTKEELICLYFNTVEFGSLSYGIKTAAFTYFYKTPKELKPEEAALLVGVVNAPSKLNPEYHPERAMARRNFVLDKMAEAKVITKAECDSLKKIPISLNFHNPDFREGRGTYVREYLRQELQNWCNNNPKPDGTHWNIYEDGLKVFTTIDSREQKYAEDAIADHLKTLQDSYFKEWRGKDPWKYGLRAKPDLLEKMMKQTDRYDDMKAAGKTEAEIKKAFETKVKMKIFSWHGGKTCTKDTLMSPMDSLRYYLQIIQVGFLAVDAKTGAIKAWVGGPNIRYFQLDHVKKSTKRQVGSTMKPFVYAAAIDKGYAPCYPIPYLPPKFSGNDSKWNPEGTNKWKEGEAVPMEEGLWYSDNRITANIISSMVTPGELVRFARLLKIESPLDSVPALCLGVSDISLYEMVGAYTCFANLGTYSKPYLIEHIEDKDGNVLAKFSPTNEEPISEKTAYTITEMMKGVINHGTGAALRGKYKFTMPLAGKTGTTQSNADAWFMCFNPDIVVGGWVGFEQPSVHFLSNSSGAGATAALPIVANFLKKSFADRGVHLGQDEFSLPSDSTININFDCTVPDSSQKKENPGHFF